ncbi:Lreu_0056 family protein [Limosilactobacillus allomucosae]|uniref:Lreu_0056 family protein n=1 Tax=Limosilactobacillus allomucosae TaxID=3142938 RepID=UPI003263AEDD
MNKKIITATMIALAGFGLAACGQQSSSSNAKSSSSSTSSTSHQKSTKTASTASSSSSISSSSSSASSTSSSQTEKIDDRTLAVMVGLQYNQEWFTSLINNEAGTGVYFIDTPLDFSTSPEFNGYLEITGNGDAASDVFFKRDGSNVIYTTFEVGENQAMYQGHYVKNTIPMNELIENYYQTSSQKAEIAKYASQLKSEAELKNSN